VSERTRVRRSPERARTARSDLDAVLDAGRVAHVAIVSDGQPLVIPMAYARRGDDILLHGSTGSRLMRTLAAGAPACVTVTVLDGLVLARSAFESSMNYRSAMVLGQARLITGEDADSALEALTEHLLPGRGREVRPMTTRERAATMILAIDISEASVKVRTGGPDDPDEDDPRWAGIWAGVVPIEERLGTPVPDGGSTTLPLPASVAQWRR
jgi:nitroimidazol reductase NimA-like FMN-containing flavoprotein (pyridoxamine 5'-phosphate oxidase superfamily)